MSDEDDWSDEDGDDGWGGDGDGDGWGGDDEFVEDMGGGGPEYIQDYDDLSHEMMKFYKNSSPDKQSMADSKISRYRQVMTDEEKHAPDDCEYRIRSLGAIMAIHAVMCNEDGVRAAYGEMFELHKISQRRTATDAIGDVKKMLVYVKDAGFQMFMYDFILEAIEPISETDWLRYGAEFSRTYMKLGEIDKVASLVDRMHDACRLPDGEDNPDKPDALLSIYALKMNLATWAGTVDEALMNELFKKTKVLTASIADSQAEYTIQKSYGLMFASRNEWEDAYNAFFSAFKQVSDSSGMEKFEALRWVVLASMLSEASVNPFAEQAARAEETNTNVQGMAKLLYAFDSDDVRKFESVLYQNRAMVDGDQFLQKYMPMVKLRLRSRVLVKLIKPYRRVRLDWLKGKLMADEAEVEALVVKCILDGSVKGRVDQINSVLDLEFGVTKRDELYDALTQWMSSVKKMQSGLESRTMRGGGMLEEEWFRFPE